MTPTVPEPAPAPSGPPTRSFLDRYRVWLIAAGIVSLSCCCGFVGLMEWLQSLSDPTTPVFRHGYSRAHSDPRVKALLGEPLSHDKRPSGRYDPDMTTGGADQTVTVRGPKGEATLHVVVHADGSPEYVVDVAEVDGADGTHIDLLTPP